MGKKLSTEFVKEQVRSIGLIPLFDEYKGCRTKIKVKCKKHGEFYIKYESIKRILNGTSPNGNGCIECWHESHRLNIEDVKQLFINKGLTPLFDEYKNGTEKIPYICNKHPEKGTQYTNLHNVRYSVMVCRECKREARGNWQRPYTVDEVRKIIIDKGFIPHIEIYTNSRQKLNIECKKHGMFTTNLYNFTHGNPCKKCADERLIKYTDAERLEYKEARGCRYYIVWRKTVLNRDNYTCQCCGSKKQLHAHHILNFLTYIKLRYNESNGITLCKKCHTKFHSTYGIRLNNKKQINEFLGEKLENRELI